MYKTKKEAIRMSFRICNLGRHFLEQDYSKDLLSIKELEDKVLIPSNEQKSHLRFKDLNALCSDEERLDGNFVSQEECASGDTIDAFNQFL